MLRGRTLKKTWAAAACAGLLAFGASGDGAWQDRLTSSLSTVVGASSAHAQSSRQEFPDAKEGSTTAAQAVVNQYKEQHSALVSAGSSAMAQVAPSGLSYKDITIAALAILLFAAVAFPFVRPRVSKAVERLNRALLEKSHGAKLRATGGLNDESGRVAAARLSGRSEADFDDKELDAMHQRLEAESKQVAADVRAASGPSTGPRVARVVMPSPEAVARSPIPPSARRSDRSGMGAAAQTALLTQSIERHDPGFDSKATKEDKNRALQKRTLADRAERMYKDLQRYYGFGSRTQLQGVLTPELYAQLAPQLADQDGSGIPQILSLIYEVLDIKEDAERYLASVYYDVTLKFDTSREPEQSQEVFIFVKAKAQGAHWKLAEIRASEPRAVQRERLAA